MNILHEGNDSLEGQEKVMYAKDEDGKYKTFSYSSKVEEYATKTAVNEYEILKKQCIQEIKERISSPIKYYMFVNRMDIPTLSSYVGFFRFRVKRHLKYDVFLKLDEKILAKYAEVFGISVEQLKCIL